MTAWPCQHVRYALEPEWEARFEPRSYGFRPGRGCQDAIEAIFNTLRGKTAKRLWILDAGLEAAFDRIDHGHLLDRLGLFPARGLIRGWLKAGVFENGKGFRADRAGKPARRRDQPVAVERRVARTGGSRRCPLPHLRR